MKIENLEPTPNPNAYKFNVEELLSHDARSFQDTQSAAQDPLARKLFAIDGVESVFYLGHFITVSKQDDKPWEEVMKQISQTLIEFDTNKLQAQKAPSAEGSDAETPQDPLYQHINEILDEMVRPALANDGGGLQLLGIEGKTVRIRYQGACGSCPSATTGTLVAIERLLKSQVDAELSVLPA